MDWETPGNQRFRSAPVEGLPFVRLRFGRARTIVVDGHWLPGFRRSWQSANTGCETYKLVGGAVIDQQYLGVREVKLIRD